MDPMYYNAPQPVSHHPHMHMGGAGHYPHPAPNPPVILQNHPLTSFDHMINKKYSTNHKKLWSTVSLAAFPNADLRRQCEHFLDCLRIHRHLFLHTYVHLACCCRGSDLCLLVIKANLWAGWDGVQQLVHHSLIRNELINLGRKYPCSLHQSMFTPDFVINEDDSDLLCHLLHCRRKPELYELPYKTESGQVIELIWQFLANCKDVEIVSRLRSQIYRMARKSAYLPHGLLIKRSSIQYEQVIGNGCNGMVSRAVMQGREIAVKKILCKHGASQNHYLETFAGEAILWKTLNHRNIVPFLGVIADDASGIGLVSPFFRNGNIKTFLIKHGSKNLRGLAKGLAKALQYIHSHEPPIIHGDVKADNVLVDDSGNACLGDFGQSYASDSGRYLDSTRVGLAVCPVYWMAPEILGGEGRAKATDKSDIYSFGCVLYEMMSGRAPFEGHSTSDVLHRVMNGERARRPGSINEADSLWKMAQRCWMSHPEDRPSATKLVSYLSSPWQKPKVVQDLLRNIM